MLERAQIGAALVAQAAPAVPVGRYLTGKRVDEVTALLPRLFNLCRGAQVAAVHAALGQPVEPGQIEGDVLRDHLLKLYVTWPGFFGHAPMPLPEDWKAGGTGLIRAVTGQAEAPATPADFAAFLASDAPAARPLRAIADSFAPGEAVAEGLPTVTMQTIGEAAPVENSVAARHAAHPVLRHLERSHGRGPLWRAAARLYDLQAAATGTLPEIERDPGAAMVPAARGAYAMRVTVAQGRVTDFDRVTPTDALLAPGGILARALASLPATRTGLADLLLDILDPCCPVRLRQVQHA